MRRVDERMRQNEMSVVAAMDVDGLKSTSKLLVLAVASLREPTQGSPGPTGSPCSTTGSDDALAVPRPLRFAYAVVDLSTGEAEAIEEFEALDLKQDLAKLEAVGRDARCLVVANEDLRQSLHPAAAAIRSDAWRPSPFFFSFVNAEPLLHALYSHEKAAGNNNECPVPTALSDKVRLIAAALRNHEGSLEPFVESVQEAYVPGVCCDSFVDNGLVVRTRGLPWQASDQDVALFFAGLNIAAGGVALCLSPDGRRNGEAIVRFECRSHRELALQRHRQFLHNRYIEVYRATGEDFLKVAVGSDLQAVQFASREAAMIVRMRGLPFDCTEQQIEQFFAADTDTPGIIDKGILFVTRPDGRPSGDAFVLFADEPSGKRALAKHKNRIGSRYIELFRTTQAEVQQVFNRTLRPSPQTPMGAHMMPSVLGKKRDCVRLRGLPYEAVVKDVADFMGPHARRIAFQGVHMIYNNQGHPSGECFIQMESEASAAAAAHSMHNKYMEIGKKKRYIEVFQCSAEEISVILNSSTAPQISPTQTTVTSAPSGTLYPGAAAALLPQPLPIQAFRAAAPGPGLPMLASQNPGLALPTTGPYFHPSQALTPDQILFASAQFAQFPVYSHEQLQLAAQQLEATSHNQALLHHAQLAAAQFHPLLPTATGSPSGMPGELVEMVPLSAPPPVALIHS